MYVLHGTLGSEQIGLTGARCTSTNIYTRGGVFG